MDLSVDWNSVFVPAIGLAEIVVRGTLMYLGLFVILRVMARRQAGHFGPADLLVIVLIADAAQNGLGKDYGSVTEGLALVLTIVAWEYLLDWISSCWTLPAGVLLIAMRRGFMASGISRTSSIFSRPLSNTAPLTSTWSARLYWRLKLRVEMPRYRNSHSIFSALVPSMVTTFCSAVTRSRPARSPRPPAKFGSDRQPAVRC